MPKARDYYKNEKWELFLRCWDCWEFKNQSEFYKTTGSLFNLTSKCKKCMSSSVKKRWRKNVDKRQVESRLYRERNKEAISKRMKDFKLRFEEIHGFKVWTLHAKAYRFIKKHGLLPIHCPICWWDKQIHFHHVSYESIDMWKIWVICCIWCHKKIHSWEIKCPEPINLEELYCNYEKQSKRTNGYNA